MKKIYIVEDEKNLRLLLQKYLENDGYVVSTFELGEDALKHINDKPDLWLLDIMLPDTDGYEIIKQIKLLDENTPVIFMSAKNDELDRVVGLELGSEDYISKPFLPREVVIRVNKLFEKLGKNISEKDIDIGEYIISKNSRSILSEDEEIKLTNNEFELLMYFVLNKNTVVNRNQILSDVWNYDYFGSDRVVDDTIRRLRKKMPKLNLETLYGVGYKLVVND